MKRILSITLVALILTMCGTMAVDAKKKTSEKKSRIVYYLVINSSTTLSEAIYERNEAAADWVMTCPIYVVKDNNGVTRYRTVYGKYSSREAANRDKISLREDWGYTDAWIWKSNGPAKCVNSGESLR